MSKQEWRTKVEAWAVGAPQRALAVLALELRQQRQPRGSQRGHLRRHACHSKSLLMLALGCVRLSNGQHSTQHQHFGRDDRLASIASAPVG